MPKFQVGDHVEWTRIIFPDDMIQGTVVRVVPRPELREDLPEYDFEFRFRIVVRFYETPLRSVRSSSASSE